MCSGLDLTYRALHFQELWYVVEHGHDCGSDEEEAFPRKVLERVDDCEEALNRHGHGDEDAAHAADVAEAEGHRHDEDVDRLAVPGPEGGQTEDADGDQQVHQVEDRETCSKGDEREYFGLNSDSERSEKTSAWGIKF